MPTISVVIPAYNAGKYIGLALDSLIDQTFQDWECIVVNDGSTDNTLAVIQEYASREPRIRFSSITNSGSAKIPRDIAISMAKSKWIVTLDADDTLEPQMIERQLERQSETGANVVLVRMQMVDVKGNLMDWRVPEADFDFSQVLTGKQAATLTLGRWRIGMAGGLVAKSLYQLRKPIKNYMNTDEYDTRQILIAAKKVAFIDVIYYYRAAPESITRAFSIKQFDTLFINKLLISLAENTYGNASEEMRMVRHSSLSDITGKQILLLRNRRKVTRQQYQALRQHIKYHYLDINNRTEIYDSWVNKILIAHNYTLFCMTTWLYVKIKK